MSLETDIPEHWDYGTIKDYCKVNQINRNPEEEFPEREFDYVTVSCVDGEQGKVEQTEKEIGKDAPSRAKREIQAGDVIVSTTRPYLRAFAIVPEELDRAICSTAFAVLTPGEDVLTKFLWYAVRFEDFVNQLKKKQRGASYPAVGIKDVKNSKIPVPLLEEQKMIVDKLDNIFESVEEIRDEQEKVEEKYDITFNSALREYIPSRDSDVNTIRFGDTGEIYGGGTPTRSKDEYWNGSIPWVSAKDMGLRKISDSQDHMTEEAFEQSSAAKSVPENSLIFVMRSSILEHTFPVSLTTDQITINQDLKTLIPKEVIDPEYLLYTLLRYEQQILKKCSKEGTTVASLDSGPLYDFKLPVPDPERQGEVVDRIENIDKKIEEVRINVERHNDIFDDLPKSVLAEAFKGNLVDFGATGKSD